MSCEDYCPEVHNASESEDSDYEVQSVPSSSSEEELKEKENKINNMIKEEVDKKFKVPDRMDHPAFKEIRTAEFDKLTEEEKINKVAVAFHKTGGIDISNILELKMLMVLIGTTEQLEGFATFPREEVYRLLDMLIYHANKHMESLDI